MKNVFTVLRSKGAKVGAASMALFASSGAFAVVPPEVQTEIDLIVADIVSLSSIVMIAVIGVTGAFVLVKWVRRGMQSV